jgi:hypothetical protein
MSEIPREELSATLAARQELGQEYDTALVDSLAERVEQVVKARVAAQQLTTPQAAPISSSALSARERIALALGSMVLAIPCSAIAGDVGGTLGLAVVWVGVVVVNVAAGISSVPRRR